MNKKILAGGIIVLVLIALIAIGINSTQIMGNFALSTNQTIKIGYLGPLSGDVASIGQGQVKAIQMAVDEINSTGGINGVKIELYVEDAACDGQTATTAMNKLVEVDKVNYVIGGQCSSETIAAAPIAEKNKVLLLSPLSSNPSITNAGDYIFRNYPSDTYQGKLAADYIANKLHIKKVAILSCLNDWGQGLKNEFKINFEANGGEVVLIQDFDKEATNLKTELSKIKTSGAEMVYLLSQEISTITAFKEAKELGINTPFFGGDVWENSNIWKEVGAIAQGAKYISPKTTQNIKFKMDFNNKYPNEEITLAATNNYDAVYIIKNAILEVGNDSTKVKDYLYTMPTYEGVAGKTAFDNHGDLITAEYAINEIQNSIPIQIETA
jgi:branched-chain amino acid transport system substrate-binding protein